MCPPRRGRKLTIALPASILSVEPSLREKTLKVGYVARAAAIFRVSEVALFLDKDSDVDDLRILTDILDYLLTPPFLRKVLVPVKKTLKYAGLLPPLQIPGHAVASELRVNEYRDGVVVRHTGRDTLIYAGLRRLVRVPRVDLPPGSRVVVRIISEDGKGVIEDPPCYWGFNVTTFNGLRDLLRSHEQSVKIATSRLGKLITENGVEELLAAKLRSSEAVLVIFGGPRKGLYEIAADEGMELDSVVDLVVNFIPNQGVKTVRTEEAIYAVLSQLNTLMERLDSRT